MMSTTFTDELIESLNQALDHAKGRTNLAQ